MEEHLSLEVQRGIKALLGDAVRGAGRVYGGKEGSHQTGLWGEEMLRAGALFPTASPSGPWKQEDPRPPKPAPRTFSEAELHPARVPQLTVGCDAPIGILSPGQQRFLAHGHSQC